jgi:hypothetical protein
MNQEEFVGPVAICGPEGSLKTTMSLTFPKRMSYFEIDIGSYRRASWRINTEGIEYKSYSADLDENRLLGQIKVGTEIRLTKKVTGQKELWQSIVHDFVAAVRNPDINTIVIDSATLLWNICHQAHLQELQELQIAKNPSIRENELREKLQPTEYGPANEKMRTVLRTSSTFHKNLVLVHYPTDEYVDRVDGRTGEIKSMKSGAEVMDGFKETMKMVDFAVWNTVKTNSSGVPERNKAGDPVVQCKIIKCGIPGMGVKAVGMVIEPSFQAIMDLKNFMLSTSKVV